jgi:MFS family permease
MVRHLPPKSLVLIAVAAALSLFGDMALYTILPLHFRSLGLNPIHVGILLSANRWIRLLTNHLAEKLTRKVDNSVLLLLALITGSLLTIVYSFIPPFWLFLLGRLLWGFSWSLIRQIGIMTSVSLSEKKSAGRTLGFYNGISRLGSMAGILMAGILFDTGGFSKALFIAAIISFTAIPFGFAGIKMLPVHIKVYKDNYKDKKKPLKATLIIQSIIVGCIGRGIIMSTLGYILQQHFGDNFSLKGIVIGIATINGIILASKNIINSVISPLLGHLSDYIGSRKSLSLFFFLGAVAMGISVFASSLFPLIFLMMLFFISDTILSISLSAIAANNGSHSFASLATGFDFGAALGPLFSWTLVEVVSIPSLSLAAGAVLYSAGLVLSLFRSNKK